MLKKKKLRCLGWREWVGLPDLDVEKIKVKVDSGARTSALHAVNIRFHPSGEKRLLQFEVFSEHENPSRKHMVEAVVVGERWVRSSSGTLTRRPVIRTRLRIGKKSWPIEVTLIDRDVMGFRMLLGRQAIRRRFLIDPARSFLRPLFSRRTR